MRIWATIAALLAALWGGGQARAAAPQKEVLAFYYGWYTKAWAAHARFTPASGEYRSMDPGTVDRQMTEMQRAGITGVIASWWPQRGAYTDAQMPILLQAAARHGLKVTVLIEQFGRDGGPRSVDEIASDFDYLASRYQRDPIWLRAYGRPVVFIYGRAIHQLRSPAEWDQVLSRVRARDGNPLIFGHNLEDLAHNPQGRANFDGSFSYSQASLHGKTPDVIRRQLPGREAQETAQRAALGRITMAVVSPGYDDSKSRKGERPILDRAGGDTYAATWEAALAANPDWVLISTYNEWIEGSQIEPSQEFGDQALRDTARFAHDFLSRSSRAR